MFLEENHKSVNEMLHYIRGAMKKKKKKEEEKKKKKKKKKKKSSIHCSLPVDIN